MFEDGLVKIANTLVGYCREGKEKQGLQELYADDAVSVEAFDNGEGREVKGVAAINAKHEWWEGAFEVHDAQVEGPFFHGADRFGVIFNIDATDRATNERAKMREMAFYTVENNKIVREEFYYGVE